MILHVGPHKTGSTALQLRLITARAHLQAHGYDYPLIGLSQYGHHRINAFLYGNAAEAGDVTDAALRGLAGGGLNIVLSSEDLIYQEEAQLERLRGLFDGFAIQIVLFIRTPVQLWPSHWQELVKFGRPESLLEYLGACFGVNSLIKPNNLNPVYQAQRFSQVFGRQNVRMFCYNNIVDDGIDLFEFFLDAVLHVPPVLPRLPTVVMNPSLPPDTVEMLRCLNEHFQRRRGGSPGSDLTAAYHAQRARIEGDARFGEFRAGFARHARTVTLDSEAEFFRRRDRQLARFLGARIENRASPDRIFAKPHSRTVPYGTPYWADQFGFGGFIAEVLDSLAPAAGGGLP
jgi:hypothetical protein